MDLKLTEQFDEVFEVDSKAKALAHYNEQLAEAKDSAELARHQCETLISVWEASRVINPTLTADETLKLVMSTRSTDMQRRAIEDFQYHVTTTVWAEKRL